MAKINVGDKVTCKIRTEAYYSGYGELPTCFMEPGEIGSVIAVDVPVVRNMGKGFSLVIVDFEKPGVVSNPATGSYIWRVAFHKGECKKI